MDKKRERFEELRERIDDAGYGTVDMPMPEWVRNYDGNYADLVGHELELFNDDAICDALFATMRDALLAGDFLGGKLATEEGPALENPRRTYRVVVDHAHRHEAWTSVEATLESPDIDAADLLEALANGEVTVTIARSGTRSVATEAGHSQIQNCVAEIDGKP